MKEEFISFEIAKLAKKKGFDSDSTSMYRIDGSIRTGEMYKQSLCLDKECVAPTQSLLQKWLRDVHFFNIEICNNASGYTWEICKAGSAYTGQSGAGTHIKFSMESGPNDSGQWNQYEEALEEGLKEALTLINK